MSGITFNRLTDVSFDKIDTRFHPYRIYPGNDRYDVYLSLKDSDSENIPDGSYEHDKGLWHIVYTIKNGTLNGPWDCTDLHGKKMSGNSENGVLKGPYTVYDKDGKIILAGNIKEKIVKRYDGETEHKKIWTGEFYTPTVHCFLDDQGQLNGPYEKIESDKIIKCNFANGRLVGDYMESDKKTGKPILKCHYNEKSQLDGRYQKYSDGDLYLDLSYKDGQLDAECIEYGFYNGESLPYRKSVFKDGKQISYILNNYDLDEKTGKYKKKELLNLPNGTKFSWDYWHSRPYGIQPELITSCRNLKELRLDNSTEDNGGTWFTSHRKIPQEIWKGVAQNTNLENVELVFMDTDFEALSHLKKLKHLTIKNKGRYGSSDFSVSDKNIATLGVLPELESLSIDTSSISSAGLKMIKKQFPKLKELSLNTDQRIVFSKEELLDAKETEVESQKPEYMWLREEDDPDFNFITIPDIIENFGHLNVTINRLTSDKLKEEAEKLEIANAPDFEDRFKELIKEKQYKKALEVLHIKGLIPNVTKDICEGSKWYPNYYYSRNDQYKGAEIKELKDGRYSILLNREKSKFSSGTGGETMYHPYSELMVLDLSEGVIAEESISLLRKQGWGLGQAIEGFDGEKAVYSDYYSLDDLSGIQTPISHRKDLRARPRAATKPEDKKSIAKLLSIGSYKRDLDAKEIKISRKKRDLEKSSLTTRAYRAKEGSTK